MHLFKNLLTNPKIDKNDKELLILQESINSLDIEMNYLHFIQLFLSGEYLKKKNQILEMKGINYFDRLIFVMKFLNKDSEILIKEYKDKAVEKGRLEAISLFSD